MITDEKFMLMLSRLSILNTEDILSEKISKIEDPRIPFDSIENEPQDYFMSLSDTEFNALLYDAIYQVKEPFVYSNSPNLLTDLSLSRPRSAIPEEAASPNNLQDIAQVEISKSKQQSEERIEIQFPETFTQPKQNSKISSALSTLLETTVGGENPLSKYSFVAGTTKETSVILNIIIPFSNSKLTIQVLKTSLVSDVIGFILMKYIEKGIKPLLPATQQASNCFELKIADDDGEIDEDFPAVDKNRQIQVFQFKTFGLVALENQVATPDGPITIFLRVHLYSTIDIRHTTTVKCDGATLLSTIHETVCKKRQVSPDLYFLFLNDMKTPLDVNKNVGTLNGTTELVMLRKSAGVSAGDVFLTKKSETDSNLDELKKMPKKMTNSDGTSVYKRYIVKIKSTFAKPEKIFCIDGEYLLLMPINADASEISNIISIHISKVSLVFAPKSDKVVTINFLKTEGTLGKYLEFEVSTSIIRRTI